VLCGAIETSHIGGGELSRLRDKQQDFTKKIFTEFLNFSVEHKRLNNFCFGDFINIFVGLSLIKIFYKL